MLIFRIEAAMICAPGDVLPEDAPVWAETCREIKGHFMRVQQGHPVTYQITRAARALC